jgi:hypothetical protein
VSEFITIKGHLRNLSIESALDEDSTSDECVRVFASFLISMGYHAESVRSALEEVAGEL